MGLMVVDLDLSPGERDRERETERTKERESLEEVGRTFKLIGIHSLDYFMSHMGFDVTCF